MRTFWSALLLLFLAACQSQAVTFQPAPTSQSSLAPEYRLAFTRQSDWLRTPDGKNFTGKGVISDPCVLFEGGRYRMWFTAARHAYASDQELGTAYAESADGITWQPRLEAGTDEPDLLLRPTPGGWDAGGVETPHVVRRPDGTYLLFYTGTLAKEANRWAIGAATSADGLTWTKVGDGPVFSGQGGWEGPFADGQEQTGGVLEPSVLFNPDLQRYQMWYAGLGKQGETIAYRVGYAESQDGLEWRRLDGPVLSPDPGGWDNATVSHVDVIYRTSKEGRAPEFHLFYFGATAESYQMAEQAGAVMIPGEIGHAYSRDGVHWEKDANPVLPVVPGTWQAWLVGGPSALAQDGRIRLWYFASGAYNTYEFHMGVAEHIGY